MRKAILYLPVSVIAWVTFAGCASTELTAVWKDPVYQDQPHRVLVYAVLKNQMRRRIFEDEFVLSFKNRGINAVPAYTVLPGEEPVNKEVLEEKLKSRGFDALLLTQVTGTRTELVQVPGMTTYQPMPPPLYYPYPAPHYRHYPGYYSAGYTAMYTPSYTAEERFVTTETSLFDVDTEKLIWSAAGTTRTGGKDQKLIRDYVAMMVDAMRRDKVVP